ncbi:hypothetical protein D3C76_400410 [compost metagenome]
MSWARFSRYCLIGLGNTAIHWLVFLLMHLRVGASQTLSNLSAFAMAASLSYFANARYTFMVRPSGARYVLYLSGMGGLSVLTGAVGDWAQRSPWLTLTGFSALSLMVGYVYSNTVVFRRDAS